MCALLVLSVLFLCTLTHSANANALHGVSIYDMDQNCVSGEAQTFNLDSRPMGVLRARQVHKVRHCSVTIDVATSHKHHRLELSAFIAKFDLAPESQLIVVAGNESYRLDNETLLTKRAFVSSTGSFRVLFSNPSFLPGANSFDIIFTTFVETHISCPDAYSFYCKDEKRCISDKLACNGYNNCGDDEDEKYCVQESTINGPTIFMAILLRLFIFFLVISIMRICCIFVGCRKAERQVHSAPRRRSAPRRVRRPAANSDDPPPYPGPPINTISEIVSSSLWTPETPPPTYKTVVKNTDGTIRY